MSKLNHSINLYREEIKDLEKQTLGKNKEELSEIYEDKLNRIERRTSTGRSDVKNYFYKEKYEVDSINEIKTPIKTEETMKNILDKKALLDINL